MKEETIEIGATWTARFGMWVAAIEWVARQFEGGGYLADWVFVTLVVITLISGIAASALECRFIVWLTVPSMACAVLGIPFAAIHGLGWLAYDGDARSQIIFLTWLFLFAPVFVIFPLVK